MLIPVVIAAGFFSLWGRSTRLAACLVLGASPLSVGFGAGVSDWVRGQPALLGRGNPRPASASIDPATRLPRRLVGGCLVEGDEWVFEGTHNLALRALTLVFGHASGTYDGPLPVRQDAQEALRAAESLARETLATRVVPVGGRQVVLAAGVGGRLATACKQSSHVRVAIWRDRVLLVEFGDAHWDEFGDGQIAAIDIERGLPLRYFYGRGCGWKPRLPRPWTPTTR